MSDTNYNKITHLVEVDEDILAVFTVTLGVQCQMENLTIAKNANISKDFVDQIFANLQENLRSIKQDTDNRVGRLKWSVNETERIRMLIIYEKDRAVVVLIKSNVSLSDSVDNILGYYYEPTIPE
jgi:hypothetical protein